MSKFFIWIFIAPLCIFGQSDYEQNTNLTICTIQENDKIETQNLSENQVSWDTLLNFSENILNRKAVIIDNFQLISPKDILHHKNSNFGNSTKKFISYFCAPNAFLFQSKQNIAISNNGNIYAKTYKGLVENFGYDFYLKQTEVTNEEYRQFITYVRDSIALELLSSVEPEKFRIFNKNGTSQLNWKVNMNKVWTNDLYAVVLSPLFNDISIDQTTSRRKLNSEILLYKFLNEKGTMDSINIYPDTLSWIHDLNYSWNEPLTQMYLWHPAYQNHPVVGVSYHQAKAYLNWLNIRGIKKLDQKNIQYKIGLPTPQEIEFSVCKLQAESYQTKNNKPDFFLFNYYRDKSVNFDLALQNLETFQLKEKLNSNTYNQKKNKIVSELVQPFSSPNSNFSGDGEIHTSVADFANPSFPGLHSISNQLFHLGSNVSEWTDANYGAYKTFIDLKIKTLQLSPYPEVFKLGNELKSRTNNFQLEDQLIMGANWLDERHSIFLGAPLNGIYAKTFSNPNTAFSTVGFRYVIRVEEADIKKTQEENTTTTLSINIFDQLNKAGFQLVNDTLEKPVQETEKFVFQNLQVKQKLNNQNAGTISNLNSKHELTRIMYKHYPSLGKAIIKNGGNFHSFYSILPNGPKNILINYALTFSNDYTLELIRL